MPLGTQDIRAELARRGTTAAAIARILRVAKSTVTRAINGDTREPDQRILACLAAILGVAPEDLRPGQPSYYSKPISQVIPPSMSDESAFPARAAAGGGR